MAELNIPSAKLTPSVMFDFSKGFFEIKGSSIPENAVEFYDPIIAAVLKYGENALPVTTVNFHFTFFNTSSSKCLLKLLSAFSSLNKRATKVKINWSYDPDDEDLLETANDLESSCGLEFNYLAVEDED
jgi:hypothetical protein